MAVFLQQPIVPIGNPSVLDELPPPAIALASDALLDVEIISNDEFRRTDNALYSIRIRKALFGSATANTVVAADIGAELQFPAGRYIIAVRHVVMNPTVSGLRAPYRLTWRVRGIGLVDGRAATYRLWHGRTISYAIDDPHTWIGCFYRKTSSICRSRLMALYGVRSPTQRQIYISLQRSDPFAALLWTRVATTTSAVFPSALCSGAIARDCASREQFAHRIEYKPIN